MYQEYINQLQVSIAPLTSDELKELLNNDEKLDMKVDDVLEVLKAQKDSLFTENRNKAERNIDKEPLIIEMRGKVTDLLAEGKECCEAVQEKLSQIKDKSGNVSQETALALLQTAAAESEEESEGLVQKFNDNEVNVEAFLEGFLAARKTMHLRKLKAEKMQELMRRQAQAATQRSSGDGGGGGGVPAAYSNMPAVGGGGSGFYPTGYAGGVPYPMGPMMPMPTPPRPY